MGGTWLHLLLSVAAVHMCWGLQAMQPTTVQPLTAANGDRLHLHGCWLCTARLALQGGNLGET
jgi:hypothetical protein